MYIVCIVLILIASALIILAVLAQNPKSGMAANFGASNQVIGVRQTSDFLEKFTWTLAIIILLLSLAATMSMPKNKIDASKSGVEKAIEQSVDGTEIVLPNQFGATTSAADAAATAAAAQEALENAEEAGTQE